MKLLCVLALGLVLTVYGPLHESMTWWAAGEALTWGSGFLLIRRLRI